MRIMSVCVCVCAISRVGANFSTHSTQTHIRSARVRVRTQKHGCKREYQDPIVCAGGNMDSISTASSPIATRTGAPL